ncbi:hypothetical protein [Kordiimonas aestuarii]|uniref:hypothetical protein n=1 Tax=Kordiimonas aestuarii TaxID=1005925 RepID=UPI0021D32C70|nr:hypothetical protein [Kordiimonas aestuarii]
MSLSPRLKTIILCTLVLPALAAGAADGPSREETLAYIQAHCTQQTWRVPPDSPFVNKTVSISLAGPTLTHEKTQMYTGSSKGSKDRIVSRYDLRKVTIGWVAYPDTQPYIGMNCADLCVRWEWNDDAPKGMVNDSFYCRDGEKAFRAFKHLQDLLGGQEKDPFAN